MKSYDATIQMKAHLSQSAIFQKFYKMKFGNLVEIYLWLAFLQTELDST